jgi:hypothetical protein
MDLVRLNKITITLKPNQYYIQLPKATDKTNLQVVVMDSMQIVEMQIRKSYQTHLTEVRVWIENLDPTVAALWSEGKYIAEVVVNAEKKGDSSLSFSNHFVPSDFKVTASTVYASVPVVSAVVDLVSIIRLRLELENNFPYELGGKNGEGAAGAGKKPLDFLQDTLAKKYLQTYAEKGRETGNPWDMSYCDLTEPVHQVDSTPSNGYKILTSTNFEALEFFFEHYPVFNTTYDWYLDDFHTKNNFTPSILVISDLTWYPAWKSGLNENLSKLLNKELPDSKTASTSKDYKAISSYGFYHFELIDHVPYYDWVSFQTVNAFPKIWAVDVSSGNVIPMNAWNAVHEESPVMTASGKIKITKNPMYKEYLTFMTEKEITESQRYKQVFQNLHPEMDTYSFTNIFIGEIDMHTVIKIKKENLAPIQNFGYDRWGIGYQVVHHLKRHTVEPAGKLGVPPNADASITESQFLPRFTLTTELVFLMVDEGDLTLPGIGKEDAAQVTENPADNSNIDTDACAQASDPSTGGTDGSGIPPNSTIAGAATALYGTNFTYCYGCASNSRMDCSAFTMKAVNAAGIGDYPNGTQNQIRWCNNHAEKIAGVENIKAGDILFFRSNGGHTGIAVSNTEFVHSSSAKKGPWKSNTRRYIKGRVTPLFAIYRIPGKKSATKEGNDGKP